MNSLIEDKQVPNGQFSQQFKNNNKTKLLNKAYTFFIYYRVIIPTDQKLTALQKISFRLKQQKILASDKYLQNSPSKSDKIVNMFFVNVENQNQLQNSFLDLKFQIVQSNHFFIQQDKTKIIFLGYESDMLHLIDKTSQFGINIKSIPFALYSPALNDQLAAFLGIFILIRQVGNNRILAIWHKKHQINCQFTLINGQALLLKKQMFGKYPSEQNKQLMIVKLKNGKISKLVYDNVNKNYFLKQYEKTLSKKDYFMSHFSVGYHSKMLMQFQQSKKIQQPSFLDRIKFGFGGFKKFCCVGKQSMKSSTGIINISFKDQKNGQMQIMKQFYDQQSLEGQLVQQKKYQHNRKILSIVLSNIDTYYGKKFPLSKMNDNKLQLISFQSQNQFHKIGSIGGQIKLKFQTEQEICIKVGNSFFVLGRPVEAIVRPYTKMRAMINKQNLQC